MNLTYPFGVGNRGCGLPRFQIDCMQNSSPTITIDRLNFTILRVDYESHFFLVFREDNCGFLDDHFQIVGDIFTDTGKFNRTLYVYTCKTPSPRVIDYTGKGELMKCNTSVYYTLYDVDNLMLEEECVLTNISIDVGRIKWVPNYTVRDARCRSSGGICGYSTSDSTTPFVCYCKDGPRTDKCPGHGNMLKNGAAIGGSVGAAVLIAAGLLVGITVYRRRKRLYFRESSVVSGVGDNEDKAMEAATQGKIGTLPVFSHEVLKQATSDFDEKNQLGDGGYGSVYLGKLQDGRAVAVKRLHQDNCKRFEQFINEVQILSTFYHPNLVRLYGCSSPQSQDLLLVYEYVPNGTLSDHLHGELKKDKGLNWDTRLKICIETAQALAFLHCHEPPIFHRDVKSSNILLDEELHVKVADFGLSRFVPLDVTHVSTAPQGTPGYVDPEYHQCFQLTDKSDVYSFGVVLMEIISAKLAVDISRNRREIVLANMAIAKIKAGALHELIDPNLEIDSNSDIKVMVTAVAKLALRCLAEEKEDRPDMKELVAQLEQIKQNGGQRKHPPFLLHSPTSALCKGKLHTLNSV
jgi:serine/threonine protein kinase